VDQVALPVAFVEVRDAAGPAAGREFFAATPDPANPSRRRSVVGTDNFVVAGDEHVMGPVDPDVVDFVLAVA
jgi:hypothetical protein